VVRALESNSGEFSVVQGIEEDVDGVKDVEANLGAWTARSIASNRGREEWLETRRAEVSFGW
jgi:hypothetical protein